MAGSGTIQEYWGLQAFVPCPWWPEGPHVGNPNPPDCPDGTGLEGTIDAGDAWLIVEATDDNDRTARGEVRITPECCDE